MISLGLLAPHRSSPRFLVGRGFDSFSEARDVAELLRNSAPVSDRRRSCNRVRRVAERLDHKNCTASADDP